MSTHLELPARCATCVRRNNCPFDQAGASAELKDKYCMIYRSVDAPFHRALPQPYNPADVFGPALTMEGMKNAMQQLSVIIMPQASANDGSVQGIAPELLQYHPNQHN